MGRRKSDYIPQPFESAKGKKEPFASIYKSMLLSPAYRELNARQRDLYTHCKFQYYGESQPYGKEYFTMNQYKWCEQYSLYSKGNANTFYKDMETLILHGLIDCYYQGAITHQKNIYKLSERWRSYGSPDYKIPANCMTAGMLRKLKDK